MSENCYSPTFTYVAQVCLLLNYLRGPPASLRIFSSCGARTGGVRSTDGAFASVSEKPTVLRRLTAVVPSSLGTSSEYETTYNGSTSATRLLSGITYSTLDHATLSLAFFTSPSRSKRAFSSSAVTLRSSHRPFPTGSSTPLGFIFNLTETPPKRNAASRPLVCTAIRRPALANSTPFSSRRSVIRYSTRLLSIVLASRELPPAHVDATSTRSQLKCLGSISLCFANPSNARRARLMASS